MVRWRFVELRTHRPIFVRVCWFEQSLKASRAKRKPERNVSGKSG